MVDLGSLSTTAALARVAGCSEAFVLLVLANPRTFYDTHEIPKRNPRRRGQRRLVVEAREPLSAAQRELLVRLEEFAKAANIGYPSDLAHGFVPGRGILSNASAHVGQPLLLRADIKAFFPTIDRNRVESALERIGLQSPFAALIARFVTLDHKLAEGICTSPLIANLVSIDLDIDLAALAKERHCRVTRYADDIAFSGDQVPERIEVESVLQKHGFTGSEGKFRTTKRGQAHYVTGLSISEPPTPFAPRPLKRRLRQEVYFCEKYGLRSHLGRAGYSTYQHGINSIDGRIRFLLGIERELGLSLRQRWTAVLEAAGAEPTHAGAARRGLGLDLHAFVDEALLPDGRLALALVLTAEADDLRQQSRAVLADELEDPFAAGRPGRLQREGLHFTANTEDTRLAYIRILAQVPVRCYVAIAEIGESDFRTTYLRLLHVLLSDRLARNHHARLVVTLEAHEDVPLNAAEATLNDAVAELRDTPRRVTHLPWINTAAKHEEAALPAPDYFLGVLGQYLRPPEERRDLHVQRFERLRGKIRLIIDLDDGQRFHRRHPLVR